MGTTKLEIANMALGHIGVGQTVANLDTERSNEAYTVNRFYDITRREILSEYNWPFATKVVALAEISEDPTTEWSYEYQYPSDCVKFIKVLSGNRIDVEDSFIEYEVAHGDTTTVIYTNEDEAYGKYIADITDETLFPFDFVMALSYRLAFYIAPTLMTGDPFQLRETAGKYALSWIGKAAARAYNETPRKEQKSQYVRGRA